MEACSEFAKHDDRKEMGRPQVVRWTVRGNG